MKVIRPVLGLAVALCASAASFQAQAFGVNLGLSLPFFSFRIGLGIGAPYTWPDYHCGYTYPACTYAPSGYAYSPPANSYAPPVAAEPPAPSAPQAPAWVPSGVGHWVPDPEPYDYTPELDTKRIPASTTAKTETVTVVRSPKGQPVYTVYQQHQ